MTRTGLTRVAGIIASVLVVAACSLLPSSGVTAPADMQLHVSNGTTLVVTLVVNGGPVQQVAPGQGADLGASQLPSLPWNAEVRSPSGRLLVGLIVHAGDASESRNADGGGSASGVAKRVDLSCGRIDIWSGPPLLGPAPGPGNPGDCAP